MATKRKTSKKLFMKNLFDEDAVKAAMAKELDIDKQDLDVSVSHYGDFGTGDDYYKVEYGNTKEWYVAKSEDSARNLAIAMVKQDLEESPENFNQSFIESHLDLDRLRRDLSSDVESMNYETLSEDAKDGFWRFVKNHGIEISPPSKQQLLNFAEKHGEDAANKAEIMNGLLDMDAEDQWQELGEEPDIDEKIVDLANEQAEEQLRDPLGYLEDLYGREDAVKQAIKIAGIDEDAAAEEAVDTDGPGHFLASYDGHLKDLPGGLVYWRHN